MYYYCDRVCRALDTAPRVELSTWVFTFNGLHRISNMKNILYVNAITKDMVGKMEVVALI